MNDETNKGGAMMFWKRCLFGIVSILVLSACGTTQHTAQPHAMPQPSPIAASSETSMAPDSDVRSSRYSMLFDTLEVPPLKVEAQTPPSEEFLEQLHQAVMEQIRNQHLFTHVVTKAEPRVLGGVLTLTAIILSWDAQPDEGTIEIRLGIEDMGTSCEFTYATTKGALKRIDAAAAGSSTGQYEIQPLVEGTAAFVHGFMRPVPYQL
ncbi:MAG TPA: hypothetical protein EYN60_04875 [Nitrospirales bacterium]|nr:hypothetical protein [Nitrospirales bacterium]